MASGDKPDNCTVPTPVRMPDSIEATVSSLHRRAGVEADQNLHPARVVLVELHVRRLADLDARITDPEATAGRRRRPKMMAYSSKRRSKRNWPSQVRNEGGEDGRQREGADQDVIALISISGSCQPSLRGVRGVAAQAPVARARGGRGNIRDPGMILLSMSSIVPSPERAFGQHAIRSQIAGCPDRASP